MDRRATALGIALLVMTGCPKKATPRSTQAAPPDARSAPAAATFTDWYPEDITLPRGVEYPCALTALPSDLAGVPDDERGYVNHVCAVLIGVIRDKQVLLTAMANELDTSEVHAAYKTTVDAALLRLRAEPVPAGLEEFQAHVLGALELQRTWFEQAVPQRTGGATMEAVHAIPQGREASSKLFAAWGLLDQRYRAWSPGVKDSVYHHLCALDLF